MPAQSASPAPPPIDPVELTRALVRRPSVTPRDAGAMAVLEEALGGLGFACRRMRFGEVENLYAKRGAPGGGGDGPNLCFAGHTDVVPVGDTAAWSHGAFDGEVVDGLLVGRGAVDMKGAVAAWIAAVSRIPAGAGTLSLLITGDEEGPAVDGTRRVVEALQAEGERIDHCVVGEPTSAATLGDTIKVGRRGSLNAWLTVEGVQGHVAYPERARNPIPVLLELAARLMRRRLDDGYPQFQPSNLEITDLAVGNDAHNVIPARAQARLNIRFNPAHAGAGLAAWLEAERAAAEEASGVRVALETVISGEAFLTPPGPFTAAVAEAVRGATGRTPELSTSGGTSDARFIRALCPVVELGLVGTTMHKVDEAAPVAEIAALADIYTALIARYVSAFGSGSSAGG